MLEIAAHVCAVIAFSDVHVICSFDWYLAKQEEILQHLRCKLTTSQHVLNARGSVSVCIYDPRTSKKAIYSESWLCKPRHVGGTSAHELAEGVQRSWDGATPYNNHSFAHILSESTDFSVNALCPDGAGGNLVFMKNIAERHQALVAANVLKSGDACPRYVCFGRC